MYFHPHIIYLFPSNLFLIHSICKNDIGLVYEDDIPFICFNLDHCTVIFP
jgi:hypothetical protein